MAVNISGLRRNIKNVAHNYTDAQVKVREATSNDPWGPSSTMMSEIADLTYNVVAFSEIMQMIWKRLNDHGKNWRHVYKALVLLEYLIKTGSEKVAQQCKENIFAIQTLKDFQYLDDNKDQGINVREKAKSLVALLKDDERLRNERVRALKAKERFAQNTAGIGSDTVYNHTRERYEPTQRSQAEFDATNPEIEAARPQTVGEEELQLQLALAMSREEAEQEETKSKSDDMRLQLALQKSKEDNKDGSGKSKPSSDLLDLDFGNPSGSSAASVATLTQPPPPQRTSASAMDPWGMPPAPPPPVSASPPANNDPWGGAGAAAPAPASKPSERIPVSNDPWSPVGSGQPASVVPPPPPTQTRTSPLPNNITPSQGAFGAATSTSPVPAAASHATSAAAGNDPWATVSSSQPPAEPESMDPFSPQAQSHLAEFDLLRNEIETAPSGNAATNGAKNGGTTSPNPFDLNDMTTGLSSSDGLASVPSTSAASTGAKPKKTVQSLLGEHSNLVNLDNLVSAASTTPAGSSRNPFEAQQQNPFQAKVQKPPLKDLMQQGTNNNNNTWGDATSSGQQGTNQAEFSPFF